MTKLEVKVKNIGTKSIIEEFSSAYLATFISPDDRILLCRNGGLLLVINTDCDGGLVLQDTQLNLYRSLKKIKKMTIEVELE